MDERGCVLRFISVGVERDDDGVPVKPGNLYIGPYTFVCTHWYICNRKGVRSRNGSCLLCTYRNESVSREEIEPYLEKAREEGGLVPFPSN